MNTGKSKLRLVGTSSLPPTSEGPMSFSEIPTPRPKPGMGLQLTHVEPAATAPLTEPEQQSGAKARHFQWGYALGIVGALVIGLLLGVLIERSRPTAQPTMAEPTITTNRSEAIPKQPIVMDDARPIAKDDHLPSKAPDKAESRRPAEPQKSSSRERRLPLDYKGTLHLD